MTMYFSYVSTLEGGKKGSEKWEITIVHTAQEMRNEEMVPTAEFVHFTIKLNQESKT